MRRFLLAVLLGTPSASFAARAPQLFDNSRDPLPNEDFMRLSKAGYKFTPEGRLLKPETGDPVQSVEMPLILEELESRQRLEAMLRLDLIFSRFGYKDLPDEQLEEVRRIGRQSWTLLSPTLRADLRGYYSGAELEALDKGVSVIRTPRTWLPDDLAEPGPDGLPIEPERDPAAPGPSDLPPTGRPLTPADTMPVTPLPAPWAKAPAPATPPAPTTYPGPTTPPVRTQVPEPAPMALRVPPPAPMALPAAPPLAPAAPAAAAAPPAPPVPTDGTRPPNASAGPAGALGGEGEGMPAVVVSGGAQPTPEAIAALQALIRTGMSPPAPGSQSTVIRTTPPVAPAPAVAAAGAPPAPAAPAPAPARAPAPAPVAPPPPPAPVPA
ncbi:MAG: hypothetical protein HY553_17740, partial [Elusimicrobia bacterium]|nr:hypothetical protein [Elusimicrobiota bacterium]